MAEEPKQQALENKQIKDEETKEMKDLKRLTMENEVEELGYITTDVIDELN